MTKRNPSENLQVANTILSQLGGSNRLSAMIGAYNFIGGEDSLSFRFKAKAKDRISGIRIILNALDLYDLEFFVIRGTNVKKLVTIADVDAFALRSVIRSTTGLYLNL